MDAKACRKGQILVKGKCMTQKGTLYRNLPQLRGRHPGDKLMNFYRDLGWDGKQEIEPMNVIVNEDDWLKLIKDMESAGMTKDERIGVGWMFTNRGPSGSSKVKHGRVKLMKGWV